MLNILSDDREKKEDEQTNEEMMLAMQQARQEAMRLRDEEMAVLEARLAEAMSAQRTGVLPEGEGEGETLEEEAISSVVTSLGRSANWLARLMPTA